MKVKIEYEYDPKIICPYVVWAETESGRVCGVSAVSYEKAKENLIKQLAASLDPLNAPPEPEEVEL